jgi:hypothetical protein
MTMHANINVTAIQQQREVWLRARAALSEREKERDDGMRRLNEAVTRAQARLDAEWETLRRSVLEAGEQLAGFLRDDCEEGPVEINHRQDSTAALLPHRAAVLVDDGCERSEVAQ